MYVVHIITMHRGPNMARYTGKYRIPKVCTVVPKNTLGKLKWSEFPKHVPSVNNNIRTKIIMNVSKTFSARLSERRTLFWCKSFAKPYEASVKEL